MRWLIPSVRSHPSLPTQRPSRANATFAAPSGKQSLLRAERDKVQEGDPAVHPVRLCVAFAGADAKGEQLAGCRPAERRTSRRPPRPRHSRRLSRRGRQSPCRWLKRGSDLGSCGRRRVARGGVGGGRVTQPAYGGGATAEKRAIAGPNGKKALRRHRVFPTSSMATPLTLSGESGPRLDPNGALAVVVRQPTAAGMRGSVVAPPSNRPWLLLHRRRPLDGPPTRRLPDGRVDPRALRRPGRLAPRTHGTPCAAPAMEPASRRARAHGNAEARSNSDSRSPARPTYQLRPSARLLFRSPPASQPGGEDRRGHRDACQR